MNRKYSVVETIHRKTTSAWKLNVLDSAFILAVVSAFCYTVGVLMEMRDARHIGLPRHLLPEHSTQSLIFSGGAFLVFFCAVGLLVLFVGVLLSRVIPKKVLTKVILRFSTAYSGHPNLFNILIAITVVASIFIVPQQFMNERRSFTDIELPAVLDIEPKPVKLHDEKDLLYFTTRDDWVVLKRKCEKSYFILNRDEIQFIEMTHEPKLKADSDCPPLFNRGDDSE